MDPDISRWILIFLAQQNGINCSILKSLLSVLPLPSDDLLLKKLVLLWSILFQIDDDSSITEDMLKWLETIEDLDSLIGASSITASLVRAYRAVAVECTVRYLPGKADRGSKYFDAVERIWRGRVRLMEQAGPDKRSGFLTDELLLWRTRLEAALSDQSVRREVLGMNVRTEAFRSLRAYLNDALEGLLPLLIQALAKDISSPEKLKGHVPVKTMRLQRLRRRRGVRIADPEELEIGVSTAAVTEEPEALEAGCLVNEPLPDAHQVGESTRSDKQDKISNLEQDVNATEKLKALQATYLGKNPLPDAHVVGGLPISEKHGKSLNLGRDVNAAKMQEALKSSYLVKDPVLDAHKVTESLASDKLKESSNLEQNVNAAEEQKVPKSSYLVKHPLLDGHKETELLVSDQHNKIPNLGQDVNAADASLKENVETCPVVPETSKNQPRKLPRSLMNRNSTAQTFEWEESEGGMEEERGNPDRRRPLLPKKRRRWSQEEEEALREGVKKFTEGQWKLILDCYPDTFEGRSSTDLKDKWRNLCRSCRPRI